MHILSSESHKKAQSGTASQMPFPLIERTLCITTLKRGKRINCKNLQCNLSLLDNEGSQTNLTCDKRNSI